MRRTSFAIAVLIICLVATLVGISIAAGTGTIEGRITAEITGDPIPGVTVFVVGTKHGAATDADGRFRILRVAPGTYTVKISSVEYNTVTITDVVVSADSTVVINHALTEKVTELDREITVHCGVDILDKYVTDSRVSISNESIKQQPVTKVDQLLGQVTGVQTTAEPEVFIRGGRAGEVTYIVDGASLPDNGEIDVAALLGLTSPWPPVNGGNAIVNGRPYEAMFFEHYGVNPFVDTEDDHLSTFATDVDDAAYVMTRSYIGRGVLPPKEAVRVEEFVNHFNYTYTSPESDPFAVYFEGSPSRFGSGNTYLLRVGIKGRHLTPEQRKAANLVFVIDVSGSMKYENRLGLVKRALHLLVDELRPDDRVGIVIYGSSGQIHMHPKSLKDRADILGKIDELHTMGATNVDQGLELGYKMADGMYDNNRTNRIILCSDGVGNVGVTRAEDLLEKYKEYIDKGITMTAVGFGMGNYNDIMMEKLGDKGNGHYAYVDDIDAARRVFVDNLTGTLEVIARDVKLQLDFNPRVVRSYRLLGYENRDVADKDFRNDTVDGGEIGSGHMTTALYEIKFYNSPQPGTIGTLSLRYKEPVTKEVAELAFPIAPNVFRRTFEETSADFKLAAAAAEFSEILRESYWARDGSLDDLRQVADAVYGQTHGDDVLEFIGLISDAKRLKETLSQK